MWTHFKNLWKFSKIFNIHNYLEMASLVLGGVFMGFLEFLGISIIFPLLMLIVQPVGALNHPFIKFLYDLLNAHSSEHLAMMLGFFVAGLFIGKNLFQAFYWRYEFRILARWRVDIITRLYDIYMRSNYEIFMQRNSSQMITTLTTIIPAVINNFIHPMLNLLNYAITAVVILAYIIHINLLASALVTLVGLILMKGYSASVRSASARIGQDIIDLSRKQYALLQQSFVGYKETRAHLKEHFFFQRFQTIADKLAQREEKLFFFGALPPAVVEMTAMLLLIIIFEVILFTGSNVQAASAQIGVIVLCCVRMLPIINRTISSISTINSTRTLLDQLFEEAEILGLENNSSSLEEAQKEVIPLPFHREMTLKDVTYTYPEKEFPAIQNINFSIKPGEFIGITGPSGGGKSTLINILLGFLTSYKGSFAIDGEAITIDNIRSLRKIIGYVDQQIFTMDSSIAENIAFGIEPEHIDRDKVISSLKKAQLWDFISTQPDGIDTPVGENGKLLSGGQRQRLAIARAFYRDLKILILDEASASLDVETEHKLFTFLDSLKGELAVIMIAHRLSTLQNCERVYFIEQGKIGDCGTFEELYRNNETFRNYIEYSQIKILEK